MWVIILACGLAPGGPMCKVIEKWRRRAVM